MSENIAEKYKTIELEYFNKIRDICESESFVNSLKLMEKSINEEYENIKNKNLTKNIINTPIERLLRYHCYKLIPAIKPFYLTYGSDICYETENAFFNLDAKTTNLITNAGDKDDLIIEKNQISFNHPRFDKVEIDSLTTFDGFLLKNNLRHTYNEKPTLTYFFKLNYEDNLKSFKMREFYLYLMPNGLVYKDLMKRPLLIQNVKSWGYVHSTKTAELLGNLELEPSKQIASHWKPFKTAQRKLYYDNKISNPVMNDSYTIRSKQDNKYKVTYSPVSARVMHSALSDFYNKEDYFYKREL